MKKAFLNWSLSLIRNNKPNISSDELDEIRYGLEGIYLTFTKAIFISVAAYFLGIFKEMIIMLLFFNILRTTAFGLHAKKSWMCWISSSIIFLLLPYISRYIIIPFYLKIILGILAIILMFKYAPADTEKHPLVNLKKRKIWKIMSVIDCSLMVLASLIIKNEAINTLIFFAIYIQILLIHPFIYKLFNLSYDNYKTYLGLNSNV